MSRNQTQSTCIPPGTALSGPDLSNDVTVFVTTVGAPSFEACLQHLDHQDCRFRTEIIDHVAPMNAAFQKMMDRCTTPYYVQVDEDMLLKPHAIRWLHDRMQSAGPEVSIVCAYLFDVHLGRPIQGVKIFRHGIVRDFPFAAVEACEIDHNERLVTAGYPLRIFKPQEVQDSEDGTLGLHGTHWTPRSIYERFANLERKCRRFPERMGLARKYPELILNRFLEEGSEADFYALMGVMAGQLEALDGEGAEKDYRTYEDMPGLDQAEAFLEAFVRERPGSA